MSTCEINTFRSHIYAPFLSPFYLFFQNSFIMMEAIMKNRNN